MTSARRALQALCPAAALKHLAGDGSDWPVISLYEEVFHFAAVHLVGERGGALEMALQGGSGFPAFQAALQHRQ
jgi:hypothetical protein